MYPVLFKFGFITVYSYGALLAIGFLVSAFLIYRNAGRFNLSGEAMLDLAVIALIFGILGARIVFILQNLPHFVKYPLEILDLSKGGLVWYGGFFGGLAAGFVYARIKAISFLNVTDLFMPYIALGQAFGRIGCFLNGCCYGAEVSAGYPFGVTFPGEEIMRHPTQLYSVLALIVIFIILRVCQENIRFAGEIVCIYGILYTLKRFGIELLRADNPRIYLGLTFSQAVSVIFFAASVALFIILKGRWKKKSLHSQ